jgi:hypothetical protein
MSDPKDENAFTREFLSELDERDESGSGEAELAGPWKVVKTGDRFGLIELWQDAEDKPFALFEDRATALKFSAALSAASRDPFFRIDWDRTAAGFPVLSPGGREEGTLSYFHERALDLAHMADYCTRSPYALAAVLEAAGPTTLRKAGVLLLRSLREEDERA